jgi:hypothetical protein
MIARSIQRSRFSAAITPSPTPTTVEKSSATPKPQRMRQGLRDQVGHRATGDDGGAQIALHDLDSQMPYCTGSGRSRP